jgi:hypothetical protein
VLRFLHAEMGAIAFAGTRNATKLANCVETAGAVGHLHRSHLAEVVRGEPGRYPKMAKISLRS